MKPYALQCTGVGKMSHSQCIFGFQLQQAGAKPYDEAQIKESWWNFKHYSCRKALFLIGKACKNHDFLMVDDEFLLRNLFLMTWKASATVLLRPHLCVPGGQMPLVEPQP